MREISLGLSYIAVEFLWIWVAATWEYYKYYITMFRLFVILDIEKELLVPIPLLQKY